MPSSSSSLVKLPSQHRSASSVLMLILSVCAITIAAQQPYVAPLPEASNEQIPSRCECLFENGCSICSKYTNSTECIATSECYWRDTARQNHLATHTDEFIKPQIVQIASEVYMAIGYGLANSILVVAREGGIIIDTMESTAAAENVVAAFRPLLNGKRIAAIIYTHSHSDHCYGTSVFANNSYSIPIFAQKNHNELMRDGNLVTGSIFPRSQRQFGNYIRTGINGHLNSGIGPALMFDNTTLMGYMPPTILVDDRMDINIAGIDVTLVNTPGESSDHLFVYFPSLKLGCVGDNIYKAFPNLYSIRGTKSRSLRLWFNSIDTVLDFNVEILAPSHTGPILSGDTIKSVLTTYRDAIQYVHDQTLRLINIGTSTEDIIDRVSLPSYLATNPYLQQFYGTVPWGVRAVIDFYLGWFEGRASKLNPLPWRVQSQRLVSLAGGADGAMVAAVNAIKENTVESHQWALQLSEAVLFNEPTHPRARQVAIHTLTFLGYQQTSANGRNYYLSDASRLRGELEYSISDAQSATSFLRLPIGTYMYSLPLLLNTRSSTSTDSFVITYAFTDTNTYTIRVRREVAQLLDYKAGTRQEKADLTIFASEAAFKTYVLVPESLTNLLAQGAMVLSPPPSEGGLELLLKAESLFDGSLRFRRLPKEVEHDVKTELQQKLKFKLF